MRRDIVLFERDRTISKSSTLLRSSYQDKPKRVGENRNVVPSAPSNPSFYKIFDTITNE